ncbi:MAG: hypothetical protein ACKOCM_02910 [Cyanobacteriota bacterium]
MLESQMGLNGVVRRFRRRRSALCGGSVAMRSQRCRIRLLGTGALNRETGGDGDS